MLAGLGRLEKPVPRSKHRAISAVLSHGIPEEVELLQNRSPPKGRLSSSRTEAPATGLRLDQSTALELNECPFGVFLSDQPQVSTPRVPPACREEDEEEECGSLRITDFANERRRSTNILRGMTQLGSPVSSRQNSRTFSAVSAPCQDSMPKESHPKGSFDSSVANSLSESMVSARHATSSSLGSISSGMSHLFTDKTSERGSVCSVMSSVPSKYREIDREANYLHCLRESGGEGGAHTGFSGGARRGEVAEVVAGLGVNGMQGMEGWIGDATVAMKIREVAAEWSPGYASVLQGATSPSVSASLVFSHARAATKNLNTPNPVLTATACLILDFLIPPSASLFSGSPEMHAEALAAKRFVIEALFVPPHKLVEMLVSKEDERSRECSVVHAGLGESGSAPSPDMLTQRLQLLTSPASAKRPPPLPPSLTPVGSALEESQCPASPPAEFGLTSALSAVLPADMSNVPTFSITPTIKEPNISFDDSCSEQSSEMKFQFSGMAKPGTPDLATSMEADGVRHQYRISQFVYLNYLQGVTLSQRRERFLRPSMMGGVVDSRNHFTNYLKNMPCFEQFRRAVYHFEELGDTLSRGMVSLGGKKLILAKGVAKWQTNLVGVVFRGWRNTMRVMQSKSEELVSLNRRHQRNLAVRQSFTRLRLHSIVSGAERRRQDVRRRLSELMALDRELTMQTDALQLSINDCREKIARETQDFEDAEKEGETQTEHLDGLMDLASQYSEEGWRYLSLLVAFPQEMHFTRDAEQGRTHSERILLPWAETIINGYLKERKKRQQAPVSLFPASQKGRRRSNTSRPGTPGVQVPAVSDDSHIMGLPEEPVSANDFSKTWCDGRCFVALLKALQIIEDSMQMPNSDVRRVELVGQSLGKVFIEVHPSTIFESQSDVILVVLFKLWCKYAKEGLENIKTQTIDLSPSSKDPAVERDLQYSYEVMADWLTARQHMHKYCTYLMARRGHGTPVEVLTARQMQITAGEIGRFEEFSYGHLVPFPCTEAELTQTDFNNLRHIFSSAFSDLSTVFMKYSCKGRMEYAQYVRFLTDCRLLSKSFNKTMAAKVYARVNLLNKELNGYWQGNCHAQHGKSDEVLSDEMKFDSSEFAQLLVHIAHARQVSDRKLRGRRLPHIVEGIVVNEVLSNVNVAEVSDFRRQIWSEAVQMHVSEFRRDLMWLFRFFACKDSESVPKKKQKETALDPNTLSVSEWLIMMDTMKLKDEYLTERQAVMVFSQFRSACDNNECLVYCEFEDALCSIAVYKYKNPFDTLSSKVHKFLIALLPEIRKLR